MRKTILKILTVSLALVSLGLLAGPESSLLSLRPTRTTPPPTETSPATKTRTPPPTEPEPTSTTPPPVTDTPTPGENFLINGDLLDGTAGWSSQNGYFTDKLHGNPPCNTHTTLFFEMDNDDQSNDSWPPPGQNSEDWVWQDFTAPPEVQQFNVHWDEAHHFVPRSPTSLIEWNLYGWNNVSWELIYKVSGVDSPIGAGKCAPYPPEHRNVVVPLVQTYPLYRFEVHGIYGHFSDGVLWGHFVITE